MKTSVCYEVDSFAGASGGGLRPRAGARGAQPTRMVFVTQPGGEREGAAHSQDLFSCATIRQLIELLPATSVDLATYLDI